MPPKKKTESKKRSPKMTPTAKQVSAFMDVFDDQSGNADFGEAVDAMLAKAWELYEERAKYIVIGAIVYDPTVGRVDPDDPFGAKVAIGPYATQGDAQRAASSLSSHYHSGVHAATFVLPLYPGTANDYYTERKVARTPEGALPLPWDQMVQVKEEELARRVELYEANPGIARLPADFDIQHKCWVCGHELKEEV